jgi:hypothetical protein
LDRALTNRRVPLDALHTDPANARKHGEENMAAIVASLRRFGQAEPLVVHAATGRVIGGNGRLAAMRKLGWTEADVVELDLEAVDATALGIALNRTGELAEWDGEALAQLLQTLRDEGALDGGVERPLRAIPGVELIPAADRAANSSPGCAAPRVSVRLGSPCSAPSGVLVERRQPAGKAFPWG